MTEPKGPYDASSYDGVSFVARRSAGSTPYLRFKIPDANTDPDGKICTECYNDFGIPFQVTEEWTRYEVKFSELAQEADWGQPRPAAIDRSKIYEMQWQVAVPNADFDVWIDDVTFLCNGSD
jgi:endoglucanase